MRARGPTRKSGLVVVAAVSSIVLLMATSAWATHAYIEISIPLETVVHAPAGSTTELASADVPDGFAGHFCEVKAHSENQRSTHPGNDLVVQSGSSWVLLEDVEATPFQVTEAEEMLELDEQITVSVTMGPDHTFSAGIEVVVECFSEETTTTASVLPTQVSTSTTAAVSPTSTALPSTSIEAEAKGIQVLPFTGVEGSPAGPVALALVAAGVLSVLAARRTED